MTEEPVDHHQNNSSVKTVGTSPLWSNQCTPQLLFELLCGAESPVRRWVTKTVSVAQLLRGTLWPEVFLSLASFTIPYPSLISLMLSVDIKQHVWSKHVALCPQKRHGLLGQGWRKDLCWIDRTLRPGMTEEPVDHHLARTTALLRRWAPPPLWSNPLPIPVVEEG